MSLFFTLKRLHLTCLIMTPDFSIHYGQNLLKHYPHKFTENHEKISRLLVYSCKLIVNIWLTPKKHFSLCFHRTRQTRQWMGKQTKPTNSNGISLIEIEIEIMMNVIIFSSFVITKYIKKRFIVHVGLGFLGISCIFIYLHRFSRYFFICCKLFFLNSVNKQFQFHGSKK